VCVLQGSRALFDYRDLYCYNSFMEDSNASILIHVKTGNRTVSSNLVLPEDSLDDISVLTLKETVSKMLRPILQTKDLSCHIDGADLEDNWVGMDFGASLESDLLLLCNQNVEYRNLRLFCSRFK